VLFKIANEALGRAANNMTEADIKTVDLAPAQSGGAPSRDADNEAADNEAADNEAATMDALGMTDESVEEPQPGEKFAFMKITMK